MNAEMPIVYPNTSALIAAEEPDFPSFPVLREGAAPLGQGVQEGL